MCAKNGENWNIRTDSGIQTTAAKRSWMPEEGKKRTSCTQGV